MKKDYKYCTYTPNFPKDAYMIIAHITHKSLSRSYVRKYPFINLVTTLDEVVSDINDFSKFADNKSEIMLEDICTIVPVYFHSLFPLREEFWKSPTQNYDAQERIKLLSQAISKFEMYKLLATPHIENEFETVAAAIPFYLSADNSLIEKFMLTSDWPVDPKAKYAALYLFNKPKRFNWKTKEITDLNNEIRNYNN